MTNPQGQPSTIDCFTLLETDKIQCLDDGFVRLVDVMPRQALTDRNNVEHAIVECARISFGNGVKSPSVDKNLIEYLYRNGHTSPFESVKFKFHIRCPIFVRTHLIRHRTANVNEYSLRYAPVKESFYKPSSDLDSVPGGTIRLQNKVQHQGSESIKDSELKDKLMSKMIETEKHLELIYRDYEELVELGLSREIARFCLPQSQYTELYFTLDLHNFLKFYGLRADVAHAQAETVVFAQAMMDLVKPLIPNVYEAFTKFNSEGMRLSKEEVKCIRNGEREIKSSKTGNLEFKEKLERLGLLSDRVKLE